MDFVQAVLDRRSVRTYRKGAIEPGQLKLVRDWVAVAEKGPFDSTVEFSLLERHGGPGSPKLGTYGTIRGAELFLAGTVAQDAPFGLEDYGFLFERLLLKFTALGLGTCWLGGSFKREQFSSAVVPADGRIVPAVSPVGVPAEKHSLREAVTLTLIRPRQRKAPAELFFDDSFRQPLELSEQIRLPFELVRLGPSAVNRQPWRIVRSRERFHFYRFSPAKPAVGDGVELPRLDMGIAMCHFDIGARALGWQGEWVSQDPWLSGVPRTLRYCFSYVR